MATPIHDQNRAYRRGLILGFTMAEIAIIIIFCLLLASAYAIERYEKRITDLESSNKELEGIKEVLAHLGDKSSEPTKIKELFKELVLNKEHITSLEEKNRELEKVRVEHEKYSELIRVLKEGANEQLPVEEVAKSLKYGNQVKAIIEEKKMGELPPEAIKELFEKSGDQAKIIADKNIAEVEAQRLKGQLANAQQKLEKLGKGTEMPACWADPKTGRPEYIFKIDLTSTGLIVHDQKLTNRVNEQALLPLNMIKFDSEVNKDVFRVDTLPLFNWSVAHECRFFVLVSDKTKPEEKAIYKSMLYTLEEHFYKFEMR